MLVLYYTKYAGQLVLDNHIVELQGYMLNNLIFGLLYGLGSNIIKKKSTSKFASV